MEVKNHTLDKDYLDKVIEYYKQILKKQRNGEITLSGFELEKVLFSYMIELKGFDGLPTIMKDEAYAALPTHEYYRGTKSLDHHGNLLCDYNYHKGVGCYSSGLYFAKSGDRALHYCRFEAGNVMRVKIDENAEIADSKTLMLGFDEIIKYFKKKLYYKNASELTKIFRIDVGKIALAYGFDGVYIYDELKDISILNRSSIIVCEKEQKRILSKCKYYNLNGTINFDQKYKDQYFPDNSSCPEA